MSQEYCPSCDEQDCYKNGICSKCNFTTQYPNNLKCCSCGGEVEIHGPITDYYGIGETENLEKYELECMEYGCLPEVEGISDISNDTKEEIGMAYIKLCRNRI